MPPSARVSDCRPELDRPTGDIIGGIMRCLICISDMPRAGFMFSDVMIFEILKLYDPLP